MNPGANKKPTFLWQGILIVAPVLVLAAVGAFSVRQDSVLARHEAADRAQTIADELLPKIRAELVARRPDREHEFQVDSAGRLVSPPPSPAVPTPRPLDPGSLTAQQANLWRAAQLTEGNGSDHAAAAQAYLDFLKSDPPPDFAAVARYAVALFLAQIGNSEAAATHLAELLEKFPDAIGESGLPLRPLAEIKLVELRSKGVRPGILEPGVSLEKVCSNLVYQPTPLTSHLLALLEERVSATQEKAEVQNWRRLWNEHEACRGLFSAAEPQLRTMDSGSEMPPLTASQNRNGEATQTRANGLLSNPPTESRTSSSALTRLFWFRAEGAEAAAPPLVEFTGTVAPGSNRAAQSLVPLQMGGNWLALQIDDVQNGHWVVCRSEWEVGSLAKAIVESSKHLPDYFGVGIEVAGRKLTWPAPDLRMWQEVHYMGGKGMGQVGKAFSGELASTVLASAANTADQLKLSVYLTSPTAMFKYQRVRTFWFGALIAAAALAALVGLITANRAFNRQLRLSEMKSDFVSSVSHELRAPIASVRLMAESLEAGKVIDRARQQEYFHFIDQECRRLSSLIENVLDFSRIEQGRKQYEFEPTDLLALTRRTVQLMQTYATERGVRLELEVPDPAPESVFHLSADGKAVQQALINLIDNALKHSSKGGVVKVGLEQNTEHALVAPELSGDGTRNTHDTPSSSLRIWVEDHGPGIPSGEQEKIFERFYRRGPELRRETQGVGIGLSIVKHIVEAHGGRVVVRSEVGQGSRFTIELPVLKESMGCEAAKTGRMQL